MNLIVSIVRFVDPHQPGFVECELVDAYARSHRFFDKAPIFTKESLDEEASYTRPGSIRCRVLKSWTDEHGRPLVRITTALPDSVESTDEQTEFTVVQS